MIKTSPLKAAPSQKFDQDSDTNWSDLAILCKIFVFLEIDTSGTKRFLKIPENPKEFERTPKDLFSKWHWPTFNTLTEYLSFVFWTY